MKEEKAKNKWCPFARTWEVEAATNRPLIDRCGETDESLLCLASDCMMWTGKDCGLKNPHLEEK